MRFGKARFSDASEQEMPTIFRPQLTSLIDVLTFMLVFLVKSYSVQGDVITPSDNLALPISTSQKPPKPATELEITTEDILAEGKSIASVKDVMKSDSLLILGVHDWMYVERAKYQDTAQTHEVLIQADREVEYSVLKKVMFSCSKAGFTDFTILARQKE
jgi:biopolymer transport protein ExbD